MHDVLALAQALIKRPSVTPDSGAALDFVDDTLQALGFETHRMTFESVGFEPVHNLYARRGSAGKNFCFAGHTDVVPPGDPSSWAHPPYEATVAGGNLYGRGAADMKGAIAAFIVAVERYLQQNDNEAASISLLLTGDEEGPAVNGTQKVLGWLKERDEHLDMCLVGEPTSQKVFGDTMKIGRRGSMQGFVHARGIQGHVAYPDRAKNPIPGLLKAMSALDGLVIDSGNTAFQPSNLEVLDLDVGNDRDNVIPQDAHGRFNVRFNSDHTSATLIKQLEEVAKNAAENVSLTWRVSGESFLTPEGPLSTSVQEAVHDVTGTTPELSTGGGTSDARFITTMCPVVEFGLIGATMHKANEHVAVADLETLAQVYENVLQRVLI